MNDYPADAPFAAMDPALTQTAETLGAWWFVTPSPAYNRAQALDAWERHQDATIVTNGQEYGIVLEVWTIPTGWYQTSPEELTD